MWDVDIPLNLDRDRWGQGAGTRSGRGSSDHYGPPTTVDIALGTRGPLPNTELAAAS